MTILWCGGEDVDFNFASVNTAGVSFDGDFSRYSLVRSITDFNRTNVLFDVIQSAWLHCKLYCWDGWYNYPIIGLAKSSGSGISGGIFYGPGSTAGSTGVWKRDGSTNTKLADYGERVYGTYTTVHMDMQVIDYGSSATVNVYIDGVLSLTYSGDISISGVAGFDTVSFIGDTSAAVSEIIVSDEDTRIMRLKTIAPSAAGDTNDWDGAYTDVDETTISDADKIYSATDDDDFQCNLTGLPTGTWSVKAVKVAARCVDGSGSKGIQLGVKSGGTVGSGDTQTAYGYWQTKERIMQVNPVTGISFTPDEIEALQINLRAKAL